MKFCLIATGSKQACLLTTCPFTVAETSESMSQETVSTFVHVYCILYYTWLCLCACAPVHNLEIGYGCFLSHSLAFETGPM